ncbi:MAG: TetR/AcrR family transcriptional regulator [Oscillospiraceae bacterium]|nr:TetR/AcrR family transcriptional regulator [Oscillospiraceae bacterium]
MSKKNQRNTKSKIVSAAWKLFYEQGFEYTTVDEIISESKTSKGSFYHYFSGKDELLGSLSYLFDEKYEEITPELLKNSSSFQKLIFMNEKLFSMIEDSISIDLLARMYSSQLTTKGEKQLLDYSRSYFKLLREVVSEGQKNGEIRNDLSTNEIVKIYALIERGLLYDWCICNGDYPLGSYSQKTLPNLLAFIKNPE